MNVFECKFLVYMQSHAFNLNYGNIYEYIKITSMIKDQFEHN